MIVRFNPFLRAALCMAAVMSLSAWTDAAKLKVGDPAPPLVAGKWVKGEPVTKFEPGKMYVVEFWATWCGPCRVSIPHLTELQHKYKDEVTFIGMSVWENNQADVEPFVKEMGDKMDYRVAMDDVSEGGRGKMAETWMAAAEQRGIPAAFLVDKSGKIAWIGHPMALEAVLKKAVAGTFDSAQQAATDTRKQELSQKLGQALQSRDLDSALKVVDEIEQFDPAVAGQLQGLRFQINLEKKDYPAAYAAAAKAAEAMNDNPQALNEIAWTIADKEGIEQRDLDMALKIAERAAELTKHQDAAILDTLARVHFDKGNKAKAIEIQTVAVEKADDSLKQELQATLEKYKSAS